MQPCWSGAAGARASREPTPLHRALRERLCDIDHDPDCFTLVVSGEQRLPDIDPRSRQERGRTAAAPEFAGTVRAVPLAACPREHELVFSGEWSKGAAVLYDPAHWTSDPGRLTGPQLEACRRAWRMEFRRLGAADYLRAACADPAVSTELCVKLGANLAALPAEWSPAVAACAVEETRDALTFHWRVDSLDRLLAEGAGVPADPFPARYPKSDFGVRVHRCTGGSR